MRRVIPILFLFLYLLAYTDAGEIFFLPRLVEHFKDHRLRNPDLSLYDFLAIHYFAVTNDNSSTDHQDLPFTHIHGKVPASNMPSTFTAEILRIAITCVDNLTGYNQPDATAKFLSSIWQPPRAERY